MSIDAESAAKALEQAAEQIRRLGKDFTGAAVLCPPEGEPVKMVLGGTELSARTYFNLVKEAIERASGAAQPQPGIGFGR